MNGPRDGAWPALEMGWPALAARGEDDPAYIAGIWQKAPAFYTAPDYERPPGAKE